MRADYFAERVSRIGRRVVAWRQQVREWGQGVASVVARSRSRLAVSRAFCRDVAARY